MVTPEHRRELVVVNPDGLHARPAALIVAALAPLDATVTAENRRTGGEPVAIAGPISLLLLAAGGGDTLAFTATGADAAAALDAIEALLAEGSNEPAGWSAGGSIGVSPGRAVGPVLRMPEPLAEPRPRAVADAVAETGRLVAALAEVGEFLAERAARARGVAREILEASGVLAADPALLADASAIVSTGESAERAVWLAAGQLADQLAMQGGRTAERVADVHDLRNRVVAALSGRPAPGVPDRAEPFVLVARELAPADAVTLDPATCLALITEEGGPTSHTAIVVRGLGIPAIVAARGTHDLADGVTVLVDGSIGRLEVDPSAEVVADVATQPDAVPFGGAGATRDGHAVPLLANIGSPDDIADALAASAEGVGLFRTEFCFLDRDTAPDVAEQIAAYRGVFAAFPGRTVVVRTLDAGADKPLAFVTDADEANPALGIRGIRTSWRHPRLLADQLEAIALAAAQERAVVEVMAPMIATLDEAEQFAALCRQHGLTRVGLTIETPSAVLLAAELVRVVDFVSVGTNDLTQYAMAADRLVGDLAALNDPWQPAVLRLVGLAAAAATATATPIGVCGEAAADPLLAAVLVGLGVTSLSMSPRAIAAVAAQLSAVTLTQCRAAAAAARSAPTAAAARHQAVSKLGSLPLG